MSKKPRATDPDEFEELMEEERDDGHMPATHDTIAPRAVTDASPFSGLTVTVANPTPPTNFSFDAYGTPPTPVSMTAKDDGTAGPLTAVAAPLSVVTPQGTVPEATGSVVVDTELDGVTKSITVMGSYTNAPNATHPSALAPATLPTITGLVPATTAGTGGTMNLTVNGTGFQENSVVYVGGVPNATNYISTTQLQALNAPKRTSAGTTPITVVTGGTATAPTNWTFV